MIDEKTVREKLQGDRDRVQARIATIQGNERRETAEGQTDAAHLWEDADVRDADLDEATDELSAIDDALQRLAQGSYGICTSCGGPISEGRLEVMPYAVTCVDCAES
jgi:DnaK suppressor protein